MKNLAHKGSDRAASIYSWNKSLRLVSLWELLNGMLICLGETLIKHLMYLQSMDRILDQAGDLEVDEDTRKKIFKAAGALILIAGQLKLKVSEWSACSLWEAAPRFTKSSALSPFVHDTALTFMRELHSIKFLPATLDMENYLDIPFPFGKHVSESFPECAEDICECYQCLGWGQYTAAMFHLGRAMEVAVKRLAKRMGVKKPARDEWQAYINAMNEKIRNMPYGTTKQKAIRAIFSAATDYLFNFKEAWRNPTMHPKKTYYRAEALTVIEGAKHFLGHISKSLFKKKAAA